jgi:prevent-host-death family protein
MSSRSEKSDSLGRMRVSATEASRGFSALLNRVAAGETVEVDRHGEVVAVVAPRRGGSISGAALRELLGRLPHADADFADDVRSLSLVTRPSVDPWES